MGSPSVLLLSTYPILKPRHGGQLRARALVEAYRAGGFEAAHLAVVEKGAFPRGALGPLDVEFPTQDPRWFLGGQDVPVSNDVRSGDFAASDDAYRRVLASLPRKIDVFHLEQPWLLPLVQRLKQEPRYERALIVYGSQNIEAPLREGIFRLKGLKHSELVVGRVLELESTACRLADLTLTVSPADHDVLQRMGARTVLSAPNGIEAWSAKPRLVERWRTKLHARRIALFVGSAHPPNVDGFVKAMGDSLGFVPPDCRIVIAGGVGVHLADHYQRARFNTLNLSRLEVTGELEDEELAALKTLASVFLLPIFEGGGSNIKTAEAIYSGKPVIATSTSLRGFDAYARLPEIQVADTRDAFQAAMRKALSPSSLAPANLEGAGLRAKLLWNQSLGSVAPAVRQLLAR